MSENSIVFIIYHKPEGVNPWFMVVELKAISE